MLLLPGFAGTAGMSPCCVEVSRGPAFLSERLQQASAELLVLLTERCREPGPGSAAGTDRHWAAVPQQWQPGVLRQLARMLLCPSALLRVPAEELCMAATRLGPPAAAAEALARLHPGAAPLLQPLLDRQKRQKPGQKPGGAQPQTQKPVASSNRFVRQQTAPRPTTGGSAGGAARSAVAAAHTSRAGDIIDLTDSPPRAAALPYGASAPPKAGSRKQAQQAQQAVQAQQQQADSPWFMQWPSRQQAQQQVGQQAVQQPTQQLRQAEQKSKPNNQQVMDVEKLWPAEWPSRSLAADGPAPAAAAARGGRAPPVAQHPARREQHQGPERTGQRQPENSQRAPPARPGLSAAAAAVPRPQAALPGQQQPELDIDALWPASWPTRKPAGLLKEGGGLGSDACFSSMPAQRSRGASRAASPEPLTRPPSGLRAEAQRRTASRSGSPEATVRQRSSSVPLAAGGKIASAGEKSKPGSSSFRIPKRQATAACGAATAAATMPAERGHSSIAGTRAAAPQQPSAQQAQRLASLSRSASAGAEPLQLVEDDDELFAGLPPIAGNGGNQGTGRRMPPSRQLAAPAQPVRRVVHLAAPPAAALGGRRGAGAAAVPLWQQRRAALGQRRQLAAAAAALLTMDQLLQQLLAWEPSAILSGSGAAALQGLKVPVRFSSLQQYTQVSVGAPARFRSIGGSGSSGVWLLGCGSGRPMPCRLSTRWPKAPFRRHCAAPHLLLVNESQTCPVLSPRRPQAFSQLLLEEVRAHLQQAAEENPAAPTLCQRGGVASWHEAASALAAAGAVPLRLLEAQRQSDLHLLRFEPVAGASGGGQVESAAEFARSSGIRADDLLLIASRAAAPATPAGGTGAGQQPAPVAVTLAAVESVHTSQPSDRRPQQGTVGRQRQLLLTMRVSLRGGGSGSAGRQLLQQQLTPSTQWQAVRLFSLTPHLRQLQALVAAQKLPPLLLAELLEPQGSAGAGASTTQLSSVQPPLPPPLLRQLQQQYNSSQRSAIAAAATGFRPAASKAAVAARSGAADGGEPGAAAAVQQQAGQQCVLVQGPPGTGKTAAILGMLSAFLAPNTPKPGKAANDGSSKAGSSAARKQQAAAAVAASRQAVVNPTVRVLLVAQSNAAVDELCTRLAARGVIGRWALAALSTCSGHGPIGWLFVFVLDRPGARILQVASKHACRHVPAPALQGRRAASRVPGAVWAPRSHQPRSGGASY